MRKVVLVLLSLGVCLLFPGSSLGDDLYQLAISSGKDLQTIEELPVQYFGRVQTETEDFVLIYIDPLKTDVLDKLKSPRRKLATASEGKTFYWIYPNPIKSLPEPLLSIELVRDREGILVNISPKEAERLSAEGFSIRLLVSLPTGISSTAPKSLKGIMGDRVGSPKPVIREMMDQVTQSAVYTYTGDLTGEWPVTIGEAPYTISTRNSYRTVEIQKAGQYLYEFYKKTGPGGIIERVCLLGHFAAKYSRPEERKRFPRANYSDSQSL